VRAVASFVLLSPLGLVGGCFFPMGVVTAAAIDERLVPWAWGINGCASVSGTVLAVICAMAFGFQFVWVVSVVIYAIGTVALARLAPVPG
jgi:hypothetical protein